MQGIQSGSRKRVTPGTTPGVRVPKPRISGFAGIPTYSRLNLDVLTVIVGLLPVIDGFSPLAHFLNRRSRIVATWSVTLVKRAHSALYRTRNTEEHTAQRCARRCTYPAGTPGVPVQTLLGYDSGNLLRSTGGSSTPIFSNSSASINLFDDSDFESSPDTKIVRTFLLRTLKVHVYLANQRVPLNQPSRVPLFHKSASHNSGNRAQ